MTEMIKLKNKQNMYFIVWISFGVFFYFLLIFLFKGILQSRLALTIWHGQNIDKYVYFYEI